MRLKTIASTWRRAGAVFAAAVLAGMPGWTAELVMVEQPGCAWCQRWDEEIAPIYPKTAEGAFAPLRRVDLHDFPDDLKAARRINFTPTFLIMENGHEIARLEGYPGEDFFWPLLARLLHDHAGFEPAAGTRPGS
ncbi:hypothetical protein ACUXV3_06355 [Roseobacteraceae bacterium NS-SX3]